MKDIRVWQNAEFFFNFLGKREWDHVKRKKLVHFYNPEDKREKEHWDKLGKFSFRLLPQSFWKSYNIICNRRICAQCSALLFYQHIIESTQNEFFFWLEIAILKNLFFLIECKSNAKKYNIDIITVPYYTRWIEIDALRSTHTGCRRSRHEIFWNCCSQSNINVNNYRVAAVQTTSIGKNRYVLILSFRLDIISISILYVISIKNAYIEPIKRVINCLWPVEQHNQFTIFPIQITIIIGKDYYLFCA